MKLFPFLPSLRRRRKSSMFGLSQGALTGLILAVAGMAILGEQFKPDFAEVDVVETTPVQPKMYAHKSGVVVSKQIRLDGTPEKFRQYLFWDDWGLKTAKYQIDPADGLHGSKTIINISQDGDQLVLGEHSGLITLGKDGQTQTGDVPPWTGETLASVTPGDWNVPLYPLLIDRAGFPKTNEQRQYLGRVCQVYYLNVREYCIWDGIPILETWDHSFPDQKRGAPPSQQHLGYVLWPEKIELGLVDPAHFEYPGFDWPDALLPELSKHGLITPN